MKKTVVGLDIGGANLKAAHCNGTAIISPFPLWKNPAGLPDALRTLLNALPSFDLLAVTMTGELCDCFESKREGVHVILDGVEAVAKGASVWIWQCARDETTGRLGRFVDGSTARTQHLQTAASNWLALACFGGRYVPKGPALLIDIGSTTTDIVPLLDGQPTPSGLIDPERLACGELIYTGAHRTPVCALLGSDIAAEFFATMQDVYLVMGDIEEDPADCSTADGRCATRTAAHARLARMLCADLETSTGEQRLALALRAARRQLHLIRLGTDKVAKRLPALPQHVILSGSGEFLGRRLLQNQPLFQKAITISLEGTLSKQVSMAACAHAVAVLAVEKANSL